MRAVPRDLRDTWLVVRRDRITQLAMLQLSAGGMLLFMFALLVPRFVTDVLGRPAEDSVFVFWPVGVGALLALRALPALGRRFTPTGIVTTALFGLTVSIGAFAAIHFLVNALQGTLFGLDRVEGDVLFIGVTLVLAFPMGVTYAMVNAPAQTVAARAHPRRHPGPGLRLAADVRQRRLDGRAARGRRHRGRRGRGDGAVRGRRAHPAGGVGQRSTSGGRCAARATSGRRPWPEPAPGAGGRWEPDGGAVVGCASSGPRAARSVGLSDGGARWSKSRKSRSRASACP